MSKRLPSPTCYMCRKRRAIKLTASRDGQVYVNARDVVMFCSLRCAANHGLLWGVPEIDNTDHFCYATGQWEQGAGYECLECQEILAPAD